MVRTPSISTSFYSPGLAPSDPDQLRRFIEEELRKIAAAFMLVSSGHIDKTYVAPAKPREGDVRLADGTQWNPGSGAGFYGYYGGVWHFLG